MVLTDTTRPVVYKTSSLPLGEYLTSLQNIKKWFQIMLLPHRHTFKVCINYLCSDRQTGGATISYVFLLNEVRCK